MQNANKTTRKVNLNMCACAVGSSAQLAAHASLRPTQLEFYRLETMSDQIINAKQNQPQK